MALRLPILKNLFSTIKVPIQAIKKLREQTSAPISQCKTALQESNLDHEAALSWLKQKGLMQAQKRLSKQTRQGVVGAMVTGCRSKIALIQVNCQTDFVAKSQLFVNFVNNIMYRAIQAQYLMDYQKGEQNKDQIQAFLADSASTDLFPQDNTVQTLHQQYKLVISRLQQNIRIRRIVTLHSDKSQQASVAQFQVQPQINEQDQHQLQTFAQFSDNIATQILGAPPKYMDISQISQQQINQAKQKVKKQMSERLQKAPAHTHQKIIQGKLNSSFYQSVLLPKMNYILSNDGIPVQQYWKQVQSQINKKIKITNKFTWICK